MRRIGMMTLVLSVLGCGSSTAAAPTAPTAASTVTETVAPEVAVEVGDAALAQAIAYVTGIEEGAIVVDVHESITALDDGEIGEGESTSSELIVGEVRRVAPGDIREALPGALWSETEFETIGEEETSTILAGRDAALNQGWEAITQAHPNAHDLRSNAFVTNIAGVGGHGAGGCTFLSPHGGETKPFAERSASELYLIVCATNDRID